MLSSAPPRLARLALLRARVALCASSSSRPHVGDAAELPFLLVRPRGLATEAGASATDAAAQTKLPKYRDYTFALTPQHRRVTVVAAPAARNRCGDGASSPPTPIVVSTSDDPERIVVRAPLAANDRSRWTIALGAYGPEARESSTDDDDNHAGAGAGAPPPPPLELRLPPRFCGLDISSSGGDVTVGGSGVQEADVRIVVVGGASTTTTTTTTTISATRLRCGDLLLLDAGPSGRVAAKELTAARLEVVAGRGVELGRVSALDARIEAGGRLELGALYGRKAVLRLAGGGGGGGGGDGGGGGGGAPAGVPPSSSSSLLLPLLRVNQLSCGGDDDGVAGDDAPPHGGATLEAWPPGSGPVAVRVDGSLAGRAVVSSGGGPVALAAVQAAGGLRALDVDSGGGDVDVSLDTGSAGGGGAGRGASAAASPAAAPSAAATVRVANASELSVDPALGLRDDGRLPLNGGGGGDCEVTVDAGGTGRVALRARSWMDGVMARAREAREAEVGAGGRRRP
jgi:hypothetical protein